MFSNIMNQHNFYTSFSTIYLIRFDFTTFLLEFWKYLAEITQWIDNRNYLECYREEYQKHLEILKMWMSFNYIYFLDHLLKIYSIFSANIATIQSSLGFQLKLTAYCKFPITQQMLGNCLENCLQGFLKSKRIFSKYTLRYLRKKLHFITSEHRI